MSKCCENTHLDKRQGRMIMRLHLPSRPGMNVGIISPKGGYGRNAISDGQILALAKLIGLLAHVWRNVVKIVTVPSLP